MSHKYHKSVSRDANHFDVADALQKAGNSVLDLAMVGNDAPDLLGANRKHAVLFEIKTPGGAFDLGQLKFLANWRGFSAFCTNGEEAVRIMRSPDELALSEKEKVRILRLVAGYERANDIKYHETGKKVERPRVSVAQFETDFDSSLI